MIGSSWAVEEVVELQVVSRESGSAQRGKWGRYVILARAEVGYRDGLPWWRET